MPKFIKTNEISEISPKGLETTRQVLFTNDEIVGRVVLNPSLLIEVTESHAANVIRPQQKYQEVSDEVLELVDEERALREEVKANRAAKPSKPAAKNKQAGKDSGAKSDEGSTLKFGAA